MKLTFVSNYLNHHQEPLCREWMNYPDLEFTFVATAPIREERLKLGYRDMNQANFVIRAYESKEQERAAKELCADSDVVIVGSAPEEYAQLRLAENKLLFRYSERMFKNGLLHRFSPRAMETVYRLHGRFRSQKVFLLCAGAYVASDFQRMGAYCGKAYKWGYFPAVNVYEDLEAVIAAKKPNTILWVGRFLRWKHPELALEAAERLKRAGHSFQLNMVGTGEMYQDIAGRIKEKGLEDCVLLLGSMSQEEVRKQMEESGIFLFTSDFHEGWGAVLNESMSSACAVVASHAAGAVPVLVNHGGNGMVFQSGDQESLFRGLEKLLLNGSLRKRIQRNAYQTMADEWSPNIAAERFVVLAEALLQQDICDRFETGPCSPADKLKNGWFRG